MEEKELTVDYLDFINDPTQEPLDIVYAMFKRIGSTKFKDLLKEAELNIFDDDLLNVKHKKNIIKFL